MNTSDSIKKIGIDGSTLKIIAMVIMLLDHIGAAVIERLYAMNTIDFYGNSYLLTIDLLLRIIGRTAFPIFCFLLLEGFSHTHNVKKYAVRLLMFSVISEVPFDLAFWGKINWNYQNVFFTLFLGLITIWGIREITSFFSRKVELKSSSGFQLLCYKIMSFLGAGILLGLTCTIATILKTDYSWGGVLFITILYLFQHLRKTGSIIGYLELCAFNSLEIFSFPAWILKAFYNGKRGIDLKYIFYLFYPVHLLLLYGICQLYIHFI